MNKLIYKDKFYQNICNICGNKNTHFVFNRPDGLGVFECQNCGLAFVNPMPSKENILEIYKNQNIDFETLKNKFYDQKKTGSNKSIIRRISKFKKISGSRILDIGCGPGFLLYDLKKAGAKGTGLEISKALVSFGRKELGLDIQEGTLENSSLSLASFDIVVCSNLIEHLSDPIGFFSRLDRVLAPAGIVYFSTPNYDATKEYGNKWPGFYKDFEHIFYFNKRSLTYALSRLDLKPIKFFYLPQTGGIIGKKNINYEKSSSRTKIRKILLNTPILNKFLWEMIFLTRRLANSKSIREGTAFEMEAIFEKTKV
ncbi:MAG: class I SAM-dependent methyltransferase [bacterium]|nr:class I SAM-dependent methyltransferase [bacterium]